MVSGLLPMFVAFPRVGLRFVRMQGLGVSMDLKTFAGIPDPLLLRAKVTVTPFGRSPFIVGNVAITQPGNPARLFTGTSIYNWHPEPKSKVFEFLIEADDEIVSANGFKSKWNDIVDSVVLRLVIVGQTDPNHKLSSSQLEVGRITRPK
jgi:hypothetical protein